MRDVIDKLLVTTPAMQWINGFKRKQLIENIANDKEGSMIMAVGYLIGVLHNPNSRSENSSQIYNLCTILAEKSQIDISADRTVMFSGSAQPRAEQFVNDNPEYNLIHSTPAGALLEMFQLFHPELQLAREQRYSPWNILSNRLAHQAKGNITAIIDEPKATSTFVNEEIGILLANSLVTSINNMNKFKFWNELKISNLENGVNITSFKHEICKKHCQSQDTCFSLCLKIA